MTYIQIQTDCLALFVCAHLFLFAVLDGSDCVMLSGEVAKGKYPVQSVSIMARISREAETARNSYPYFQSMVASLKKPFGTAETVAAAAVQAAFDQHASAMIVITNSGTTARLVAKFRPACPIVAVVGNKWLFGPFNVCLCYLPRI